MILKIKIKNEGEMIRDSDWFTDKNYLRHNGRCDWCLIPLELITSLTIFNQRKQYWKVLWEAK